MSLFVDDAPEPSPKAQVFLSKSESDCLAAALGRSWTAQALRDVGVTGLEAVTQNRVLLLLCSSEEKHYHTLNFSKPRLSRHHHTRKAALAYLRSRHDSAATVVTAKYTIQAAGSPDGQPQAFSPAVESVALLVCTCLQGKLPAAEMNCCTFPLSA